MTTTLSYSCLFAAGAWNPEDWLPVMSPRWPCQGAWLDEPDHIRNRVPADASLAQMQGARAGETYASMLYREPVEGALQVRAEMSFDECMAPLIVLAAEPAPEAGGRRAYREHVEVVLFDQGINVWHHHWSAERGPYWHRAAWARFAVAPHQRYALEVERAGPALAVRCGPHHFGVRLDLPERLYAGITGCEGTNRFYSFDLTAGEK